MTKALCLFSGGKNSTVALAWAIATYPQVIALSFNYPSRPGLERTAAREIAARYFVKQIEINASFLKVAGEAAEFAAESPQTEATYSPMRNLVFHAIALSIAEQIRADVVVAGHIKPDGGVHRDGERNYMMQIYALANSGARPSGRLSAARIDLRLPLINKSLSEVIKMGQSLSAPLELSWPAL